MNHDVRSYQNSTMPIELTDSEPLVLDDDVQIINNRDCVTLDDDSDVIIEENNPVIVDIDSDLEIIESNNTPIVIEDEDPNCVINPLNVVKKKQDDLLDAVCQENSLLAQVIEDAVHLDASGSMKRIIQRTLIPLYLSCKISYRESEVFKNNLKRTTILLETAPHLKYSHIKSLCESLKYTHRKKKLTHKGNKRQQTQTQSNGSSPRKRKQKYKKIRKHKKRKKDKTNDLTDPKEKRNNTESFNPKENNASSRTMIEIEIPNTTSISPTNDKENIAINEIQSTNDRLNTNFKDMPSIDTIPNNVDNNIAIEPNNLLRPQYAVNTLMPPETGQQTVESLEREIATLKKSLETLEEQEVTSDSIFSPYIMADTLKNKIVKLYQQLCDLMGAEPIKRHEVKLQVVNGHPVGPARCLEEYINDNIDEYGNPPFPDIFEVVRCVERAVDEDRLKWNRKQIVAEAQVLLKHYGHAIQKRRKKREWRDMVSLCKEELIDPAELDPALEAKLLANSRIAKRNEDEILDKYARLETENSSNPAFRLSLETGADSESDSNENICRPNQNKPVQNIQEPPSLTMADSTTNSENIQGCCNVINSTNIQGNPSALNPRNILEINPQGCSSIINSIRVGSNGINTNNIVESTVRKTSSLINPTTSLTTNLQNGPILLLNPQNNVIPNLHGSICFINSTPVLATRIQDSPNSINSTNNLEGNLQNGPYLMNSNYLTVNPQNGPDFINTNNLSDNLQRGLNFINSNNLAGNLRMGYQINSSNILEHILRPSFINSSNNLENNLQSRQSITLNNIAGNLQSGYNIINSSNHIESSLRSRQSIINISNNSEGNLQSGLNNLGGNLQSGSSFINSSNNLESSRQSRQSIINISNNSEGNLQKGLNNLESKVQSEPNNLKANQNSCPIDSTTDTETQSTITNIGNVEYNRTIMMDSNGSDTDNERKDHTDVLTNTDTVKERDKSDIDEIEYKIKVKQEEEDVMKLLSELGSDCTGTVFDIEDPFLVIEISDSSDDET